MADITIGKEHQAHATRLLKAMSDDAELRARLVVQPKAVLDEYGLSGLLENREVNVVLDVQAAKEKSLEEGLAFILGFHFDVHPPHADVEGHQDISTPHADAAPHIDVPALHADTQHVDVLPHHLDI
jgi:hypothetical protein